MTTSDRRRVRVTRVAAAALLGAALVGLTNCPSPQAQNTVDTLETLPHAPAFTEGLTLHDGLFLESSGLRPGSFLRTTDTSGKVRTSVKLPDEVFAEGATTDGSTVWVMTWMDRKLLRYTWPELRPLPTASFGREAWGLTYANSTLLLSDGSATIRLLDPETLVEREHFTVTDGGRPVDQLNELEFDARGERPVLWANVWRTNKLLKIAVPNGQVITTFDLSKQAADAAAGRQLGEEDVANGIALGADRTLWVTGKNWPSLYRIRP